MLITTNKFLKIFIFTIFVGGCLPALADFNQGDLSRTATTHTGSIVCPGNNIINNFQLAFDTSSASFANKPYDVLINGVKLYSATTSGIDTSGYNSFSTATPITHNSFACNGFVTWTASSTSASSIRIKYSDINGGSLRFSPSYTTNNLDSYVSITISGATLALPGYKIQKYQVPVATTTVSVSLNQSSTTGTTTISTQNDNLWTFTLLYTIFIVSILFFIKIGKPLYDRE